jgi:hypothetical protein
MATLSRVKVDIKSFNWHETVKQPQERVTGSQQSLCLGPGKGCDYGRAGEGFLEWLAKVSFMA